MTDQLIRPYKLYYYIVSQPIYFRKSCGTRVFKNIFYRNHTHFWSLQTVHLTHKSSKGHAILAWNVDNILDENWINTLVKSIVAEDAGTVDLNSCYAN